MVNAQTTMISGFTPAFAECISIKSSLCDATCAAFDVPIAQATLSTLGLTELPAGLTSSTAGLWASMAYAVTYNATAATMMQVYPALDAVFECEARNAGLIWAEYIAAFDAITLCKNDADCVTAHNTIRTTSEAMPFGATWVYTPEMEWWNPSLTDSTSEQMCNIFFVALEENNAKALFVIQSALATMLPAATSNGIMEYCNGQGILDLAVSDATNGFVPSVPTCARLKSLLCRDSDCRTVDTTIAYQVMATAGVTSLPAGLTTATGGLWAQMAFVVTYFGTGGGVNSIHPVMNWVFECEAFYTGQTWADYVGVWKATQTCMNDADCVTAFTNIRTKSESGDVEAGTSQDKGANWMYIAEIDWYVPDAANNVEANYCNMFFAALAEENAKATYLLSSMTALLFTNEYSKSINEYCSSDMEAFVEGIVTTFVTKYIIIFTFVGIFAGALSTGLGCWCCNRRSKSISA